MKRIRWIVPLVLWLLAAALLIALPDTQPTAAISFTSTASPTPVVLIFASNGRASEMYSDQYGIFQLYYSTDLDAPLTDREGHATTPAWSPDGTRIAYTYSDLDWSHTYIEVMDLDGSNRERLTDSGTDSNPVWSPDDSQLAFLSQRDNAYEEGWVYIMNSDGSEARLIRDDVRASSRAWSPDGTKMLITSVDRVYLMNADGSNLHPLLETSKANWDAVWSPDGSTIAYIIDNGIYLTDNEGRTSRYLELTGSWVYFLRDGFSAGGLAWSWDGSRIAFSVSAGYLETAISTPVPPERVGWQIMTADVVTGEVDLITAGFENIDPDWHPAP
jgi:TolB protein